MRLHPFRENLKGWRFFIFGQNKEKPAVQKYREKRSTEAQAVWKHGEEQKITEYGEKKLGE